MTTGGRTLVREVRRSASYLSASDPRLLFGLAGAEVAEQIEIHWPSGTMQKLEQIPANQYLVIEESTDR
jgi:hypothetical protein